MAFDAVWACLLFMAVAMGLVALPLFRFVDSGASARPRHASIDGLRGFLALSVFGFHAVVTRQFIETGRWEAPGHGLQALLGPVGVSLFFMITGFLFWTQLLRAQGRPDWRALYVGRLYRIAPMYLFVVVVMLVVVLWRTGFEWREPPAQVVGAVLQWLALGVVDTQPDVNGVEARHVLAGVTWTIFYEWAFYASLLVTAFFAHGRRHLLFVAVALALCLAGKTLLKLDALGFAALFLIGMGVASLLHLGLRPRVPDGVASALALLCLAPLAVLPISGYATPAALLLAGFFYWVGAGASLFGLLTSTPARRLGNISYSLYLMQGLVLTLCFAVEPLRAAGIASPVAYGALILACGVVLIVSASLGFALIERPWIARGKRRLGQRPERKPSSRGVVQTAPL